MHCDTTKKLKTKTIIKLIAEKLICTKARKFMRLAFSYGNTKSFLKFKGENCSFSHY